MSILAIVGVLSVQAASGTLWWAALRRDRTISALEAVGLGLALGTFASMASAMTLTATPLAAVAWAIPALVTAVIAVVARIRGPLRLARLSLPGSQMLAVVAGLASGLALLVGNWARTPLEAPPALQLSDLYFFEAISRGLAEFGPAQSILMTGGSLRYHWFTYAWAGELAQTAGAASFVTITRVLPLVTLVGVCLLAASWAGRLSRVRWVPTLAVLLVVAGGYTGALYGAILNFDSPSQSMTTLWLLALAVAFVVLLDRRTPLVRALIAVGVLSVAVTGGKVSHAAVAVGGMSLVTLVGLVARTPWARRATLGLVVAAALMLATYLWVLSGVAVDRNLTEALAVKASTWQGLDPFAGAWGVGLGTAALVLAVLARLTGLGWLLAVRRMRVDPSVLFAAGSAAVGLAALLLLREGVNELWFVLAASAPAAVVSAAGVGHALHRLVRPPAPMRRPLLWAVAVAVPTSLAPLALSLNWPQHQALLNWLAPLSAWVLAPLASLLVAAWRRPGGRIVMPAVALSVAALALTSIATRPASLWTANRPVTTERGGIAPASGLPLPDGAAQVVPPIDAPPSDVDALSAAAAAWLDAHAGRADVIATTYPVSAYVPAMVGRPMYLAGDVYQVGLGSADELAVIEERREVSSSLYSGLTPPARTHICSAGVDWIWYLGPRERALALGLPIAYANAAVTILTLPAANCAAG